MSLETELPLVTTITAGLSLAFICGLAASKLRISPIIGYLAAGIIIGPYSPGFVADMKLAQELSEIGIVLLMFGVGLHFSIADLMKVKKIAVPGAVVQIGAATFMGAALAHLMWNWPLSGGLMFGLALSVASTVVMLRALEEHNLLQTVNGRIAIGWLIVEDLVMVLALVMIPALATPVAGSEDMGGGVWSQLSIAIFKVAAFVAIMVVAGRRFLPWLLGAVATTGSRELFTLAVFAMAVGLAFGASKLFGVSFALGAFFAGMMIRDSRLSHEVANRALPFQDAFAVLFFVAVGMLFNPAVLWQEPVSVLLTATVIIVGKSVAALLIVLALRYPLKTGLLVSASLAQIGEFSFILIGLGLTYDLLPEKGSDLILAGALISIALNPLVFFASRRFLNFVEQRPRLSEMFNVRDDDLSNLHGGSKHGLKNIVIVVGYGRLGRHICENVKAANIDMIVIDTNRERIEMLRKNGFQAIAGDGGHPETLEKAAIDKAVAIAVAVPDPYEARRIVGTIRSLKPSIKILARALNDEELAYFVNEGVDLPLMGVREIGRRMVEYLDEMPERTN